VTGDGLVDIEETDEPDGTISIFPNQGDGTFGARIIHPAMASTYSVVAGDFNRDRMRDLAVLDRNADSPSVFLASCAF